MCLCLCVCLFLCVFCVSVCAFQFVYHQSRCSQIWDLIILLVKLIQSIFIYSARRLILYHTHKHSHHHPLSCLHVLLERQIFVKILLILNLFFSVNRSSWSDKLICSSLGAKRLSASASLEVYIILTWECKDFHLLYSLLHPTDLPFFLTLLSNQMLWTL